MNWGEITHLDPNHLILQIQRDIQVKPGYFQLPPQKNGVGIPMYSILLVGFFPHSFHIFEAWRSPSAMIYWHWFIYTPRRLKMDTQKS